MEELVPVFDGLITLHDIIRYDNIKDIYKCILKMYDSG